MARKKILDGETEEIAEEELEIEKMPESETGLEELLEDKSGLEEATTEPIVPEKIDEETPQENAAPSGVPATVYRIEGTELILNVGGNGVRIPLSEKYKNVKKGDIVYL